MTISKLIEKFSMTLSNTAFVALSATTAAQAISITPTNNGNDLVNQILHTGITIAPDSINYIGASGASGIFTDGLSSGIGIDSGIILTTGTATDAEGPNDSDKKTTDNELPGDSDLDGLIPEEQTTFDATILEFEFESEGGDLYFNYVFASEEYVEWTNTKFNDVFGFFLDGTNIALIPGTSTPVAINTVNGGKPLGTDASNPEFFNNNDLSEGGPFFDLEYDGFTNVFTAQALGLSAGTHNIRLAIADAGDGIFDSAVFIQANSFSDVLVEPQPTSQPTSKPQLTSRPSSEPQATLQPKSPHNRDLGPQQGLVETEALIAENAPVDPGAVLTVQLHLDDGRLDQHLALTALLQLIEVAAYQVVLAVSCRHGHQAGHRIDLDTIGNRNAVRIGLLQRYAQDAVQIDRQLAPEIGQGTVVNLGAGTVVAAAAGFARCAPGCGYLRRDSNGGVALPRHVDIRQLVGVTVGC
ncbi:MAG: choice-of-anchor L domain-containing protein, partial [Cyanobacteriota bacterium]|nr:choice-of-anchor L domain-containing protein [Cyanobacteriota bacterium]